MENVLIVGRMSPKWESNVSDLFASFDASEMPQRMGTRQRELFTYHGLYFHLQRFDAGTEGSEQIVAARNDPLFVRISTDLRPFVLPFDPTTWRSPADAMAKPFYRWSAEGI